MRRLLPPLIVLAVLGTVAWRYALQPARAVEQARVLALVHRGELLDARKALGRYATAYRDAEDVWFVAETRLRCGDAPEAIAALFSDPRFAQDPDAPARLARAALREVGWEFGDLASPRPVEPEALAALTDGKDPEAEALLRKRVSELELGGANMYFFRTFQNALPHTMEVAVEELSKRSDERLKVAAAISAARPGPRTLSDPARKRLRKVVGSATWRRQALDVWHISAYALSKEGTNEDRAWLRSLEAELPTAAEAPLTPLGMEMFRLHPIFAGDLTAARDRLEAPGAAQHVLGPASPWFTEGVLHCARLGWSPELQALIEQTFDALAAVKNQGIERLVVGLYLEEFLPPEGALPIDAWLGELESASDDLYRQAIAAAVRLRLGKAGALDALGTVLERCSRTRQEGDEIALSRRADHGAIAALRALLLWGAPRP